MAIRDASNHVPQAFCTLIEMTMSKMVATGVLDPELNSAEFWKAFSRKFTSVQSYESRKKKAADAEQENGDDDTEVNNNKVVIKNHIKIYRK